MLKLSIIIPVYNAEKYLSKCLDSLVNQTLNDLEIIIVNDGSVDGSQTVIDYYISKYPNQVFSYFQENKGAGAARNFALTKANGEYVSFVDSDDFVDSNMFRSMLAEAEKNNADLIISEMLIVKNEVIENEEKFYILNDDNVKWFLINQAGPCAKLIRKKLIIDNNLLFPNIKSYEDLAVVPAYGFYANKIIKMNEKYYYYLIHEGSIMKQKVYSDKLENIYYSIQYLSDIFKKENKEKIYNDELEYIYIEHLLHAAGLRFIDFDNYKINIDKIHNIMREKYPKWYKNKYYKLHDLKYRIMCRLIYAKKIKLIKNLKRK